VGAIREAPPAKLFMAVMHRPELDPGPLLARLAERYGEVDARSAAFIFASDYYEAEMGSGLVKFFASFAPLMPQGRLAAVKRETNELEEGEADAQGRRCNLDPGIVTHYSVIMATTKGYAHRVYLGEGIYAEPTLIFRSGGPEALPWTYPDYRTPLAHNFFTQARRGLLSARPVADGARPPTET
jgi:hypothetical protein